MRRKEAVFETMAAESIREAVAWQSQDWLEGYNLRKSRRDNDF